MIIRLFCVHCARAASKNLPHAPIEVPMPVVTIADDGRYEVHCAAGHVSTVYLDNLKFELLFEMGLNALVDDDNRDAVSSFAASLERFYEFFWHVACRAINMPTQEVARAWKAAIKLSERQLGMFVTAHLFLLKRAPELLNPNTDVKLRNDVIHGGYIPKRDEACSFGNVVMKLINGSLDDLRKCAPKEIDAVHRELSPAHREKSTGGSTDEMNGITNHLSAVDVLHPVKDENDLRRGTVEDQFKRIMRDREPHQLILMSQEEMNKRHPDNPLRGSNQQAG